MVLRKTSGAHERSVGDWLLGVLLVLFCGVSGAQAPESELVDLSIEELSRLIVTSVSRRPESPDVAASAIQVITADEIRRSGATRIPEALRLASNLQVAQITGDAWAISARGFNGALANKLLVMIDGRTVYSPLFAGTFWEALDAPLFDVDRIEVISGPGGALWGANAVNGVINIVTRSAAESQGLLVRGGGGNELRGAGALRYGGELGNRIQYRVYGQYSDRDGVQLASGADAPNDSRIGQTGFRLDGNASELDSFTLQGDASESRTQQGAGDDAVARYENVLARWTRALSDSNSVQLQAFYDRAYRLSPGAYRDQLDTVDVELQHRFRVGTAHRIVWGLTYRDIDDDFGNAFFAMDPASVSLERIGGFVQDEIALSRDRFYLTIGTKLEDNEYTGAEWQPSIGLAWRYQPGQLLWSRVSRAVRTPSRFDRDLANGARPPFTIGGDRFESEELLAYEAGLKLQPLTGLSASIAAYYNEYDKVRSFERLNPAFPIPVVVSNELEGDSYGGELTVEYRPAAQWRLWGGYSYLDLDLDRKPGSTDPTSGAGEARDWNHQAFLRSSLNLQGGWEIDGELRRIGEIASHRLPAYTELNLRVGWHMTPSLEFSLVGRNLLHGEHAEFGPPGRQLIERAAYVQFTWRPQ